MLKFGAFSRAAEMQPQSKISRDDSDSGWRLSA
jgi:hypothetical protein